MEECKHVWQEMKVFSGTGTDGHFHRHSLCEICQAELHEIFKDSVLISEEITQ